VYERWWDRVFEKGDKVRVPNGRVEEVEWVLNGRVGVGGEIYELSELKLIRRQLYTTRLTKSIENMTPEELKDFLSEQFSNRNSAMVNSLESVRAKRGTGKTPKSTKRATAKPLVDHFAKLQQIDGVSPELIASIKERLQGGTRNANQGVQEKVENIPVV